MLGQDPVYSFVSNGDSETSRLVSAVEVDLTEASDTVYPGEEIKKNCPFRQFPYLARPAEIESTTF